MGNAPLSRAVCNGKMPPMKSLASVLLATALLAGCQNESKLGGSNSGLEARVKKLEEQNAKYAEALDFLEVLLPHRPDQLLVGRFGRPAGGEDRSQRAEREGEPVSPRQTSCFHFLAGWRSGASVAATAPAQNRSRCRSASPNVVSMAVSRLT